MPTAVSVESEYRTQCQLRVSSLSISVDAVQCCSSMKTDLRIVIASLKTLGLVVLVLVSSTSLALGPGGGCIDVLKFGVWAIVLVGDIESLMVIMVEIWGVEEFRS